MSKKKGYTQLEITVSSKYNKKERLAIAQDVIDFMTLRTLDGKKSGGGKFAPYSKAYKASDDFKLSGKSSNVNLKLSFDMLTEMEIISTSTGKIKVGYTKDNPEQGKAEGNIRGTYGQKSPISGKARDFLQMNGVEEKKVLKNYPLRGKDGEKASDIRQERILTLNEIDKQADTFLERIHLWGQNFDDKITETN